MFRTIGRLTVKTHSGYVYECGHKWYARFDYTDELGKRRTIRRRAENKADAKKLLDKLLHEYKKRGPEAMDGERMSFKDLADYYETTYLTPPEYVGDRKVAGQRDYINARGLLKVSRQAFGGRLLRSISYSDIERLRLARVRCSTIHGKQRSLATVNRELSLLRRVLNVAVRNGWLIRSPMLGAKSLISPGDEKPRQRILTREEEIRLLAACDGPRAYLTPIIIMALDTGMRRGEILSLRWSDLNFASRIITVRAFNTKTMRERQVAMTERVIEAISQLPIVEPEALVFGVTWSPKKAFDTALRKAGISDLHFHDLRATAATRMIRVGIPLAEVARVLGHSQPLTTYRHYVMANAETALRVATALDSFNANRTDADRLGSMVH